MSQFNHDSGKLAVQRARRRLLPNEGRNMLDGLAIRSRREVADIMGISVQRVQQIEREIFWKLRKRLAPYNDFNRDQQQPSTGARDQRPSTP